MDPRRIPPMRSGLGEHVTTSGLDLDHERMQQRLISAIAVMTRRSGRLARTRCIHDRRDVVTPDDVSAALKYHARHFLYMLDRPDVEAEITEMHRRLYLDFDDSGDDSDDDDSDDDDSDDDDSDDDDLDDDVSDGDDNGMKDIAKSIVDSSDPVPPRIDDPMFDQCACSECADIRRAVETWDDWIPEDEVESYMKTSVQKSIDAVDARVKKNM